MNPNEPMVNITYETIVCEQSWHFDIADKIEFKVPAVDYTGCRTAEDKIQRFCEVYSAEVALNFIIAEHPIAARNEFRKLCNGKLCDAKSISDAKELMKSWNGLPSSSKTNANAKVELSKAKTELANAKLQELKSAREMCATILEFCPDHNVVRAKIKTAFPNLEAEAILQAVLLDAKSE